MGRKLLTLMLAGLTVCGCAGRMNVDLLQARIRQQEAQLAESQLQIAKTQSELKRSRIETERLKTELAQTNGATDDAPVTVQLHKVKINPLASGGLNKDGLPGDDTIVVQFAPINSENQPVKIPGELELVLIDPQLSRTNKEIGRWEMTSDECLNHWTRGISGSGFQFNLPLDEPAFHADLIVQLQYTTQDSRRFQASQRIKINPPRQGVVHQKNRPPKKVAPLIDDIDDPPPPAGDSAANESTEEGAAWDQADSPAEPTKVGRTILHSANWTDATIPRLR